MSKKIGDLRIAVGIDPRDMEKGAARVRASLKSMARVAKVAGVAAGAAFAASAVGMAAMTRQGLASVDAQAKLARSVDGSVDGMRALQIAGGDAGVSVAAVGKSMQLMGAKLAEAARDGFGPAAEALDLLGLSAGDLVDLDVDERLAVIADRISTLGLNAQQTSDILAQFGIRNKEMALLVLQGGSAIRAARGEVAEFGLSLDRDGVAAVERANDAMSRLSFVFEGMRNQLAVAVAPALETAAMQFKQMSATGGPLQNAVSEIAAAFGDLIKVLADPAFIQAATTIGVTIFNAVGGLSKAIVILTENAEITGAAMIALGGAMAFFSGPIGLAIAAIAGGVYILSTRLGQSKTAAEQAAEAERLLVEQLGKLDTSNADAVASGEALIATHIDQARAALEAAKAELALVRSRQMAGSALLDQNPLTAGDNSGYAAAMAANTAAAEAELDAADAQLERYQKTLEGFTRGRYPSQGTSPAQGTLPPAVGDAITPDEGGGASDPFGAQTLQAELAALISVLDPAAAGVERVKEAMRLLTEAKMAGLVTDAEYIERARQINETLGTTPAASSAAVAGIRAIQNEMTEAEQVNQDFADGFESAIGSLISNIDSGMGAVKAFALEMAKLFLIKGVSKLLGGGDWLSGDLLTIGANALGTENWRGGLSWVGERGPEVVNLPRGAQVIPNNRINAGGGGGGFTYAPKIDARGASLAAVQELDGRMKADALQFDAKVRAANAKARSGRYG
jgi:hypothetical protein